MGSLYQRLVEEVRRNREDLLAAGYVEGCYEQDPEPPTVTLDPALLPAETETTDTYRDYAVDPWGGQA